MKTIIIIFAVIGILILVWLVDFTCKRDARKKMTGRPRRSSLDFGKTFYPDHAEIAGQVRDLLSEQLPIDLSQIEPTDEPVADLHMDDLDSMSTVTFLMALEERFDISITDKVAGEMLTFDDICSHVISQIEKKNLDNMQVEATA